MSKESKSQALKQRLFYLSSRAELQSIKLVGSNAELLPPGEGSAESVSFEPCRLEATLTHHGEAVVPSDADNALVCLAQFELEGRNAEHTDRVICRFSCSWVLIYEIEGASQEDEAALQFFADKNAVYNAWPFFREHIHSLTTKMELPPFVAPLFKPRLDADYRNRSVEDGWCAS